LNEIAQVHFCDVTVDGERWPVIGWTIATRDGTVLVDTGMVDSTPELDADWSPAIFDWDVPGLVAVVNTHLHFDHCGGNRRYAGLPPYVQRRELETAVAPSISSRMEYVTSPPSTTSPSSFRTTTAWWPAE